MLILLDYQIELIIRLHGVLRYLDLALDPSLRVCGKPRQE